MERQFATVCGVVVLTGTVLIFGSACKLAYGIYKRKCFELEIANDIIKVQGKVIEALSKEKKKQD